MDNVETYIYTKNDLVNSEQSIIFPQGNTDKISQISNVAAPLFTCNDIQVGLISFINNSTKYNKLSFNTSLGTIITPHGSLVVNFNYETINNQFLPLNKTVKANPTFKSGLYENYKDIVVTVLPLDDAKSTRILTITY